ncbi:MAG: 50S ribosome-binding GTPase [Planctomycetes bacterium]|nr:50S ribosome-binding GTPase [Planctomycetota bacterium]
MLLDQAEGALRRELAALPAAEPLARRRALALLAERARVARWLVEPARVVIAGPANAGKSTLFNVLLGEERAIVHAEAGTTRDALREPALLGAYPVWLHDTAGERELEPGAEVEALGQARARLLVVGADLVLWLDERAPARAPQFANLCRLPARAALEHPESARARTSECFREALRLPAQPWEPGAGVPFEHELARGIAQLDPHEGSGAWQAALERLLGPAPTSADCL